jgi:periplasmic glucans biosynthesis protein
MRRRELFPLLAGLGFVPAARAAAAAPPAAAPASTDPASTAPASTAPLATSAFDAATVRNLARELARKPYQAPDSKLPDELANLKYSDYQTLRFDTSKALWRGEGTRFTAQFFHRGFLFKDRVDILEVVDGQAKPFHYSTDLFDLGKVQPAPQGDLGFAGFRVHYPINRPEYNDEVCAFLGASYFRAVARGQGYGLSARGLAIKTGDPGGEEFPLFKTFWLERPAKESDVLVIHALLDSQSAAAAFRFTLRPGVETTMDTELALYPRTDIAQVGLAPMTSMFLFDANNRAGFDDYRDSVHDSHGLGLLTGKGERLWRPLNNPHALQISSFQDASPRGFGLTQRERDFHDYQDLEAVYEKRPSLWVEPIGDWGQGAVTLVEIPSDKEVNDNIVGFWRPKDTFIAKGEFFLSYRLHWCWEPAEDQALAKITQTRCGLSFDTKNRQFVVDFAGGVLKGRAETAPPVIDLHSNKGHTESATLQPMPGDAWRLSFQLAAGDEKVVELYARLLIDGRPITETWAYRWTS